MAAAAAAALLDELMGRNRNILPNEKPKELNWEDPEVKHLRNSFFFKEKFSSNYFSQFDIQRLLSNIFCF